MLTAADRNLSFGSVHQWVIDCDDSSSCLWTVHLLINFYMHSLQNISFVLRKLIFVLILTISQLKFADVHEESDIIGPVPESEEGAGQMDRLE